jgi:hypothetical protein
MASSKQKTTMNKLNRERKLRERRLDKEARKVARLNAASDIQADPDGLLQSEPEDQLPADPADSSVQLQADPSDPSVDGAGEPASAPAQLG